MVYAQALKRAVVHQFLNQRVYLGEYLRTLHGQTDQAVDGEKTPEIDPVAGFVAIAQAVMLRLGQRVCLVD